MWCIGCCCCKSSSHTKMKKNNGSLLKDQRIDLEGFMEKKTGMLKMWKSRYFVLLDDLLCYYLREEQKDSLTPLGRIFFSDIVNVERTEKKSHPFSLQIQTEHKKHLMSCASYAEREDWVNKIWDGKEKHKKQELHDPVRRRSTRLGKDFKRITIKKDPQHGIGCTIKNVGGAIFVCRIIPDGPVATSGVLRPGDQIIDINGNRVSESPIEKIKEIIRGCPEYVVCTVKPVTHYTSHDLDANPRNVPVAYTEVDPELLRQSDDEEETPYTAVEIGAHNKEDEKESSKQDIEPKENPDYMNAEAFEFDHNTLTKKLTNYAELEFGVQT